MSNNPWLHKLAQAIAWQLLCTALLIIPAIAQQSDVSRFPNPTQREHAMQTVANFKHLGFQVVAARLLLGVDTALAWRQLDTLLAKPTGDIFWMYPATGFYFNCKHLLPSYWKNRFNDVWRSYTPYRGDTENHFLMYYSSLFLFAQEWPERTSTQWFNGKSSQENYRESLDYLNTWIDETVRFGQTEWDSPRYLYYYITPLLLLRDFTTNEAQKRRFDMMLEYLLADYAAEYLNGSYCGAHSRDGDGSVIDPRKAEVTSYAQFYFGDTLDFVLPDLVYAATSPFQCPQIIHDIAHDRTAPFTHTELKRSRAKIRFADERYTQVYKTDFMTADYCIGSIQGGLQQPIQQHTWDVTYAAVLPNNTFFGLHPDASGTELGMFFPEEPELMEEAILNSKASYASSNKWIGGSQYEKLIQNKSTLYAEYNIPQSARFAFVDLFIPKSTDTIVRGENGYAYFKMGKAFTSVRVLRDSTTLEWLEEPTYWRLRLHGYTIAYVVECASERDMSFDQFITLQQEHQSVMPHGDSTFYISPFTGAYCCLQDGASFAKQNRTEADTVNEQMLFQGPHLQSAYGSGILRLSLGSRQRILDFMENEVRNE